MALIPRPRKKDMQLRHVPQRNHQPAQKRQHAFVVAAHEQVFAASSGLAKLKAQPHPPVERLRVPA